MSWAIPEAVPHRAEPARNRPMATRKRFLRPTRSPSLPYTGMATVMARV